jgi:hypothetical protein
MFMIISELLANLAKAIFYFQHDSLWKSMKLTLNRTGTHDLFDRKGVRLKVRKSCPLFSIRYGQHREANEAVEPTMCMVAKDLAENRRFAAIAHVVENRLRSSLATGSQGFRTHDVYEAECLSSRLCFADSPRPSLSSSLYVASR